LRARHAAPCACDRKPEDYELARQGTLGMGALQCGSFNLPRIAYLAGGDDAKVYEMIDSR